MTAATYRTRVIPDWIDYNGHLSEAYYVLIFGFATDTVMERIGLGAEEREETGSSLYTVEAHVRYLREVALGAKVLVHSKIISAGAKKLHLAHEMLVEDEVVATEEILALHVAGDPAASAPFPDEVAAKITEWTDPGPAPDWVGRQIG